jgi:pimeloyl-ACP methyl ester carboxylesterase
MTKIIYKSLGLYLNTLALVSPKLAGQKGSGFFCTPVSPPMKAHHQNFLNKAEKFVVPYQDLKIQAYKWGWGPKKILFLHGWQSHSFRWRDYIKALPKEEYTLYAIDAPAHGNSTGKLLHVPLYSEVIKEFMMAHGSFETVVTHSMGGFSALYALHENPTLPVNRLVLKGVPGEGLDFITFFRNLLGLSERAHGAVLDHFEGIIGKPLSYFSAQEFAGSLKIPGLIIHDMADSEAPYKYAKKVHEVWPHATLLTTEGLTHNLRSEKVVQAVTDYIMAPQSTARAGISTWN